MRLRERFHPYTLDQIHSTLIRLDGRIHLETGRLVNQHYLELTGVPRAIGHAKALEILTAHFATPLRVRIGGFRPNESAKFSSRGQPPYERMFSAQDGSLVLVGWPETTVMNGVSRKPLDDLRREMNEANILHWYHESWTDVDNDFHLVIGRYNAVSRHKANETVRDVSRYLSQHLTLIEVGLNEVAVVAADSPTLAPARLVSRLPIGPADIVDLYH